MDIEQFITRWKSSGGSERANYQLFLSELTRVLNLPVPQPATGDLRKDDYRFDHPVQYGPLDLNQRGFIDLYKRGHFVLETKQGTDAEQGSLPLFSSDPAPTTAKGHGVRGGRSWAFEMQAARGQAGNYAKGVARTDGWPPFVLVVDVGYVIEVFADFSGNGHGYCHFPDAASYRITMDDLRTPAIRERLHLIWTNPQALNPASIAARVTRQVSASLAELGKSLETRGHASEAVARYLMRCLFTMFAEDVELIPRNSFKDLLHRLRGHPQDAADALSGLWAAMDKGDFAAALTTRVKRFNGGLFRETTAFPLQPEELHLLIRAAGADWKSVEPAIFGTLLERALDTRQRHKLGAHYTPRAYVERLVVPTVIEPLRQDWDATRAAALHQLKGGDAEAARATLRTFRDRLCQIRVLDPACGSGNFLYVTMELMKRLEAEVNELLTDLGETQSAFLLQGHTIDPHQFLGIEVNPWAAAVAELVLWIGHLQWHFRTHGNASPAEPVLRDFRNIENRDAVLDWDAREPRQDATGAPVTRWDGIGTIPHPATGDRVPDPDARVQVWTYANPRAATWPQADFIVGNPPFIGSGRMREALGDGYTEALRAAYPRVPDSADFVMFWWEKAALATRAGHTRRFGLITTNSLRQTFNRKVLEPHLSDPKSPLSLAFAIPDHPWVDAGEGAAVRIAMTVGTPGTLPGRLLTVTEEAKGETEAEGRPVTLTTEKGLIFANLMIGADVAGAKALRANDGLSSPGVKLHGAGFIVTPQQAQALGLGTIPGLDQHIRHYRNGRDLTATPRDVLVIDLFGLSEAQVLARFPAVYQHIADRVKPERDAKASSSPDSAQYARLWWLHGKPRPQLRPTLEGLPRYIATVETTKHRVFQFLGAETLPDNMLIAIGINDAATLAVLSSRVHVVWALRAGGTLEDRPRYNKSQCFDPFPFPDLTDPQKASLRSLGEQLDAHRKAQQAAHPGLTLTAMYNVLEKLRTGTPLDPRDRQIYDQGLIGILRQMHDDIDAQVAAAYGWPADLPEDDLLHRLVDLNRARASEEARGLIRWLRPDYQNPQGRADGVLGEQIDMAITPTDAPGKLPWPRDLPGQVAAVQAALSRRGTATPTDIARQFKGVRSATVENLLETLTAIAQARKLDGGRYVS